MNTVRKYLPFALLLLVTFGWAGLIAQHNSQQTGTVAVIEEDDPRWDCYVHGNRVCGDPTGEHAAKAWTTWDKGQGWKSLKVDPSKGFRVEYVGTAISSPKVAITEAAVPSTDGKWYVFRATETP